MSLIQSALAVALSAVRAAAGDTVTVTRGANVSQPVQAGIGVTKFEVEHEGGVFETWVAGDYLIARSDYAAAGQTILPAAGFDVISDTVNGVAKAFLVCAPKGMQVFEFSDPGQTSLRVHTKEIT